MTTTRIRSVLGATVAAVAAATAMAPGLQAAPTRTVEARQSGVLSAAEASAAAKAAATGVAVPVPELTTETTDVVANPNGTYTLTSRRAPVRVKRSNGWVPIIRRCPSERTGSCTRGRFSTT